MVLITLLNSIGLVIITLVVMSSDYLSHWEKFTDISTFPWLGPSIDI